ncbi:alpha/beta fold hydrolase, partial [Pseudomonas aeruginosa]|uniref:alpha/beta fold hydrolase n=1 Tax=Pseudomonas aeruginosa TaxID=287 RepID=UPI000BDCA919
TVEQLGEDVVRLLDHLNISKAAFCGISMGGLTGQWLAIHYPNRFSHLVVANTAAKIGQEQAWLDRAKLVREQGLQPIAATAASRWFTDPFIQSHPSIVNNLCNDLSAGSAMGYANCCEALAKADVREQLKDIKIPVLVIAGTQDPVTAVADGEF